jgi:pimeloyl-ACP methyl ester carboxylesterase
VTNYDFNLDATKEKNMTLSQTYRTALIAIAGFLLTAVFHTRAVAQANSPQGVRNIVIVRGAWADGSNWSKVVPLLQAKGLHVVAVQNPLTSLADVVAATKRAIALQDGPVPLVGHSYGGVAITEAGNDPKLVGLVYVAALAPSDGESVAPVARQHLGSLDEATRIVRLGVLVATSGDVREHPKIADGPSELLQDVFGKDKNPGRLVYGVASLPLGMPV